MAMDIEPSIGMIARNVANTPGSAGIIEDKMAQENVITPRKVVEHPPDFVQSLSQVFLSKDASPKEGSPYRKRCLPSDVNQDLEVPHKRAKSSLESSDSSSDCSDAVPKTLTPNSSWKNESMIDRCQTESATAAPPSGREKLLIKVMTDSRPVQHSKVSIYLKPPKWQSRIRPAKQIDEKKEDANPIETGPRRRSERKWSARRNVTSCNEGQQSSGSTPGETGEKQSRRRRPFCEECGKNVSLDLDHFEDHIWTHLNLLPYQCAKCLFRCNSIGTMAMHWDESHRDGQEAMEFQCVASTEDSATFFEFFRWSLPALFDEFYDVTSAAGLDVPAKSGGLSKKMGKK